MSRRPCSSSISEIKYILNLETCISPASWTTYNLNNVTFLPLTFIPSSSLFQIQYPAYYRIFLIYIKYHTSKTETFCVIHGFSLIYFLQKYIQGAAIEYFLSICSTVHSIHTVVLGSNTKKLQRQKLFRTLRLSLELIYNSTGWFIEEQLNKVMFFFK